jgi:rhodanese-related sulfurtransferase
MSRIITRDELQASLSASNPPVLLEALPPKYYLEAHLPGAVHFPHDRVRALAAALLPDKKASLVIYCASDTCQNSHAAAATLESLGYTDVRVYAGGKKDWLEAGLAVEMGGTAQIAA